MMILTNAMPTENGDTILIHFKGHVYHLKGLLLTLK